MREIDPTETSRESAFKNWIKAPQPMVTLIKKYNIKNLIRLSRENNLKINMLICYCIGCAAKEIEEFYLLPKDNKLFQYNKLAINLIVKTIDGTIHSCDVPFNEDLETFNNEYLKRTEKVFRTNMDYDLKDHIIIGTSCIKNIYIEGAVNMYSGVFNNPFLVWGKFKKKKNKVILPISFQFHHTQMDGEQAGMFLNNLKREIKKLK